MSALSRLLVPVIRSQAAARCDVNKFAISLIPPRSLLFASHLTKANHSFTVSGAIQGLRSNAQDALLSARPKTATSIGLVRPTAAGGATAVRFLLSASSPGPLIRGLQQLRSFQLRRSGQDDWAEMSKMSISQRLKVLIKKYWYIAIPMHMVASVAWFGSLYLICRMGFDGSKLISYVKPYIVNSQQVPQSIKNIFEKDPGSLGHLAVAALLYKLATPARYLTTIFGTFYMVKFLLRSGILVKSAKDISTNVKSNYLTHAINQNIQKRVKKLRKQFKKPKS